MTEGEELVQAGVSGDDASSELAGNDDWPLLSDLELDVCVSDTVPGLNRQTPEATET